MKRINRPTVFALAIVGFQLASACSKEKNCDSQASSISACYACVGIEDKGATLETPCKDFTFTQDKTCRCKPF